MHKEMHETFFSVYSRMFWILLTTRIGNEEGIQFETDDMYKDVYFGGMEICYISPCAPVGLWNPFSVLLWFWFPAVLCS